MKLLMTVILVVAAGTARAERNPVSLENLAKMSILVVDGTVTNIQHSGTNRNAVTTGEIRVREVLKGPATNNVRVCWERYPEVEDTAEFSGRAGRPQVWFLRRPTENGFWLTFSEEVQPIDRLDAIRAALPQPKVEVGVESVQEMTRRLAPGGITKEEAGEIATNAYRILWGASPEVKVTKCELNQEKTWEVEVWWDNGLVGGGARFWIRQTGAFERAEYLPGE